MIFPCVHFCPGRVSVNVRENNHSFLLVPYFVTWTNCDLGFACVKLAHFVLSITKIQTYFARVLIRLMGTVIRSTIVPRDFLMLIFGQSPLVKHKAPLVIRSFWCEISVRILRFCFTELSKICCVSGVWKLIYLADILLLDFKKPANGSSRIDQKCTFKLPFICSLRAFSFYHPPISTQGFPVLNLIHCTVNEQSLWVQISHACLHTDTCSKAVSVPHYISSFENGLVLIPDTLSSKRTHFFMCTFCHLLFLPSL